jgi:hypothetical protein
MPKAESPDIEHVSDQIEKQLADLDVPQDLIQKTLDLGSQYGLEILTAILGAVSIYLISSGSTDYAKLSSAQSEEAEDDIVRNASQKMTMGGIGMTGIAAAAGNPLFAIPEVAIFLTSLKPYLESRSKTVRKLSDRFHSRIALLVTSLGLGAYTTINHAHDIKDVLPPLGLTSIAAALTMGSEKGLQKLYRTLTISGGTTMLAGSGLASMDAMRENNAVGAIMAAVFFALNAAFTYREVNAARCTAGSNVIAH